MTRVHAWSASFAVTWAVELLVAGALLDRRSPWISRFAAVTVANLATHPLVWFVFPAIGLGDMPTLVLSEGYAVVAELFVYAYVSPRAPLSRAIASSALANTASYVLGMGMMSIPPFSSGIDG